MWHEQPPSDQRTVPQRQPRPLHDPRERHPLNARQDVTLEFHALQLRMGHPVPLPIRHVVTGVLPPSPLPRLPTVCWIVPFLPELGQSLGPGLAVGLREIPAEIRQAILTVAPIRILEHQPAPLASVRQLVISPPFPPGGLVRLSGFAPIRLGQFRRHGDRRRGP